MHRRWFASIVLMLLMFIALWSSSLIVGEPAQQANATEIVTESGVFIAYFLDVSDGLSSEMSVLKENLTKYQWVIEDISLSAFVNGEIEFDGPAVTGAVLVIAGGSIPLSNVELETLQDYVGNGGDLVIFAGTNLNDEQTSLASSDNLNTWLYNNFGVRFNNDVVIDHGHAFQSPLLPVATAFNTDSLITTNGIDLDSPAAVLEVPNSLTISESPPADVTVDTLLWSSEESFSKTDLKAVLNSEIEQEVGDTQGPLVLAASAEIQSVQSRIVLFGSTSLGTDNFATFQGIDNLALAFNSLVWATRYDEYFYQFIAPQETAIPSTPTVTPQPTDPLPTETASITVGASENSLIVFDIVQDSSEVRFILNEVLRGTPNQVIGRTNQVAGQLAIDFTDPQNSLVGEIHINARTLETDNEFRNRAIRGQILQSAQDQYEIIVFEPTAIVGLPETVVLGETYAFQIEGDLKIRDISQPVVFDMEVTLVSLSEINGFANTTIRRVDYALQIPNVPGVADVDEEVRLEFDFVATLD